MTNAFSSFKIQLPKSSHELHLLSFLDLLHLLPSLDLWLPHDNCKISLILEATSLLFNFSLPWIQNPSPSVVHLAAVAQILRPSIERVCGVKRWM